MFIEAACRHWRVVTKRAAPASATCKNDETSNCGNSASSTGQNDSTRRTVGLFGGARKLAVAGGAIGLACVLPLLAVSAGGLYLVRHKGQAFNPGFLYLVRQKGQAFNPGFLSIHHGDTVEILNDDGELIHHAYVDSKTFSFDSGDQEPGSKTDIVFSVPGDFVVLCGIHPKMRLDVTVK